MPTYRVYTLSKDGHIDTRPKLIECPDDKAAMEQARQWLDGQLLEVWNEARKVGTLDPDDKGPS